jgi:hypothetical protein
VTRHALVRVAVGIAIGLGLASLPFLRYAARVHQHPQPAAHAPVHRH